MGHWSEDLVDEIAGKVGDDVDRRMLTDVAALAGRELELLSGRSFHPPRRATSVFEPNGLPLVDVPDVLIGSTESERVVWAIPDPIDREHASVLQVLPLDPPESRAARVADALLTAGRLVAEVSQLGALSADYVLQWIGASMDHERRQHLLRRVMDPAVRFYVPVLGTAIDGWWFQICRRLLWLTSDFEDEGRLVEPLLPHKATDDKVIPLAATEPVLIVARMTQQPVDWAIAARIWPEGVERHLDRRWSILADAVHGHGVPTITIDRGSTPHEVACQLMLKCYWHGYIEGDEPAIAEAIVRAYPQPVESIRRQTIAPSTTTAAATLLEQLVRPGFDPAQGAEATRRYVRRKASIAVMEYRKQEHPARYPWTQVGLSERRFYKLLPLFAEKVNGRYDYDQAEVVEQMRTHLDAVERERAIRAAALEVLQSHGFKKEAARKWLQRHRPEDAVTAWPRGSHPDSRSGADDADA